MGFLKPGMRVVVGYVVWVGELEVEKTIVGGTASVSLSLLKLSRALDSINESPVEYNICKGIERPALRQLYTRT